jgi:DNA-binding PadR family transcriptional regulator
MSRIRSTRNAVELLPLPPLLLQILLTLAGGEHHGYAIRREIRERTGGMLDPGAGSLYGAIEKLLSENAIEESDERPDRQLDDQRRRYYRLTEFGRRVAIAEVERLRELVRFAHGKLAQKGAV